MQFAYEIIFIIALTVIYTWRQKLSTTYIFAETIFKLPWRNLIQHEKSLSIVKLCINISIKIKKMHVIFGFCHKIMGFRDLSTLLAIALESSRSNPKHLETNFVPFSYKIVNIYSYSQSCNENKLTPMCFLLNSRSHTLVYLHHITLLWKI